MAPDNEHEWFLAACKVGCAASVQALLKLDFVDPAAHDSEPLWRASAKGHVEVVQALLADGRADPSAIKNEALRSACHHGHVEVVRLLLTDRRADPSDSVMLFWASMSGHVQVVRVLLTDGRTHWRDERQHNKAFRIVRACVGDSAWFACAK